MAATEALLSFFVVPLAAWAAGLFLRWGAFAQLQRDWAQRGLAPPSAGRFAVFSTYGVVPAVLGVGLWFLGQPGVRAIEEGAVSAGAVLASVLLWAGIAYASASVAAVASQVLVLSARFPGAFAKDMGRIVTLFAIPLTGVVFAFVLSLLLFVSLDSVLQSGRAVSASGADAAVRAFVAFSIGTVAFPVAAVASNRIGDLSGRGFFRTVLLFEAAELPILLGLVMGFLAIGSLS